MKHISNYLDIYADLEQIKTKTKLQTHINDFD